MGIEESIFDNLGDGQNPKKGMGFDVFSTGFEGLHNPSFQDKAPYIDNPMAQNLSSNASPHDPKVLSTSIGEVARVLNIPKREVKELIDMDILEEDKFARKKGKTTFVTEESLSRSLNEEFEPIENLGNYVYPDDHISMRLPAEYLLKEMARFDKRFRNGHGLIEIGSKVFFEDNPDEVVSMSAVPRKQLENKVNMLSQETIDNIVWGSELISASADQYKRFEAEIRQAKAGADITGNDKISLRSILSTFDLTNNERNMGRFLRYSELGVLKLDDEGIIKDILDNHRFTGERREAMAKYLDDLYKRFYTEDREYLHHRVISHNLVNDLQLPVLSEGLWYTAPKQKVVDFVLDPENELETQDYIASMLFITAGDYFTQQMGDIGLDDLLKKEAKTYTDKDLDLLEPMFLDHTEARYHISDIDDFMEQLEEAGIYEDMIRGAHMKMDIRAYEKKGHINGTISDEKLAELLNTTPEKAASLDITKEDFGFLRDFTNKQLTKRPSKESISSERSKAERNLIRQGILPVITDDMASLETLTSTYEDAEKLYSLFKDKVPLFTDENVRDYRVTTGSFKEFTRMKFPETVLNTTEINKELERQYKIDGKKDFLFPKHLASFMFDNSDLRIDEILDFTGERWLNTVKHNNEIDKILGKDDALRKRIEWSSKLKRFYENPDAFSDYVMLGDVRDMLGVSDPDWESLKDKIELEHPIIKELESKNAKKNGKKFMTPAEFDKKYFGEHDKQYVNKKYAQKFENNFYQPKNVSKLLTGIDACLDTLVDEGSRLDIDISELRQYTLDTENKKGNFYLKQDVMQLKELSPKDRFKKLKIAMGLSARIDEARDKSGGSNYDAVSDAASRLGIDETGMKRYIESGLLETGGIGIVSTLRKMLNSSYRMNIRDNDIVAFCSADDRYKDVRMTEGVLNLDEFIADTLTITEAKEQVSGKGWLADSVFDHCADKIDRENPIYLLINGEERIHSRDNQAIEKFQMRNLSLDFIRQKIAEKLSVDKIGNKYKQLNGITRDTDSRQINEITARVENFMEECYSRSKISETIGASFSGDHSLRKLIGQVSPQGMPFNGNMYHKGTGISDPTDDVGKLVNAVNRSADKLRVSKQRIIDFAEKDYISLQAEGITDSEIRRLRENSYRLEDISRISKKLSQSQEFKNNLVAFNGDVFCPNGDIKDYLISSPISDITEEGIHMLVNDENWKEYLSHEINGNNHNGNREKKMQQIGGKIVKYLMDDINMNVLPGNSGYRGGDIKTLSSYIELLQENDVHRLAWFAKKWDRDGPTVDSDNSYYTRTEVLKMAGGIDIDRISSQKGITYLGQEKDLKGHGNENDIGLYSVTDVAEILKEGGDERLKYLADPMEVVIMHKVLPACKKLGIDESAESVLEKVGEDIFNQIGYHLKIGDNIPNIKDSFCYQRMDNAFRTLQRKAA